jgi:serine/threonine-protein kinase
LDFGIAKMSVSASDQGSKPGATRTGAVLGTPLYMSPEQARALRTLDQRTDLYSLGLVAYTMFTGNLAFSSESFGDLLFQICTAPLPSLCAQASWLPPSMEGWFQRACAREPQDRYTTALEFADGLRVAAGMTLQQRGPSMVPSQRVSGAVSSRETPALASAPSTGPGISRTDDPVGPPPGTSKLRFGLVMAGAALVVVGGAAIAAVVINRNASPPVRAAASDTTASSSDASPANPASNPATNTAGAAPTAAASPLADASAPTADAVPSLAKTAAQVVAPTEPQASHAPPAHTSSHKNTPPAAAAPTAKGAVDLGY